MKIEIQVDGVDPDKNLSHFATCCAGFELGTQRDQILCLQIQLSAASELREGNEKFCLVQVELADDHRIFTKALGPDFHIAIYHALERAGAMVAKRQQREYHQAGKMPITEPQAPGLDGPNMAA